MKLSEVAQMVCDPENQPHQYIGDFKGFSKLISGEYVVSEIIEMAIPSLPPDEFCELQRILEMLCNNRHIEYSVVPECSKCIANNCQFTIAVGSKECIGLFRQKDNKEESK